MAYSMMQHDPRHRWRWLNLNGGSIPAPLIRQAVTETFGVGAQVWLFGSRVDDRKRGGDIDLLIRPDSGITNQLLLRKIRLLGKLERSLGERKIDVMIEHVADSRPIVQAARETGVRLSCTGFHGQ